MDKVKLALTTIFEQTISLVVLLSNTCSFFEEISLEEENESSFSDDVKTVNILQKYEIKNLT